MSYSLASVRDCFDTRTSWSERPGQYVEWFKMEWVEFGCPGHGKGPWDGLGSMSKSKVTLDVIHDKEHTSTGQITSPNLVVHHL
jgi:hypothetical protein